MSENIESLGELAAQMEAEGVDASDLREHEAELETAQRPPAFLKRLGAKAKESASKHWADFVGELRESGEFPEVLPALERGDLELALRVLLEEVDHAEGDRRDRIRELMVLLFAELGQDHPLSLRYRRKLAAALY